MDSRFEPAEWRTLEITPLWVFQAVAGADQSVDDEESSKMVDEVYSSVEGASGLAKTVLKSVADAFDKVMQRYYADERKPIEGLKEVGSIVAAKAPDEREAFAEAMVGVGRRIGEAIDKEGSADDEAEAAALAQVQEALGG